MIKGSPYIFLKKLIDNFKCSLPTNIPSICSLLVGYFSYDIIRYVEKIPDSCKDDLKIPDVRLLRPKTLIIHDNQLKKIYFVINCFADEKINNYKKYYLNQITKIQNLKKLAFRSKIKTNAILKTYRKNKSKI